jgi:hypothetical protein
MNRASFAARTKFANPQEYLLAALNACMIVTYVSYCSLEGITLDELRIETEGDIDLRGLFGLDPTVQPGYDELRYTVHIRGNGTPEQFEKIHRTVMATSPNRFNLCQRHSAALAAGHRRCRCGSGRYAACRLSAHAESVQL